MTHIDVSAASLPGLVRSNNEDMLLIDTDTYRDTYAQRSFDIAGDTHLVLAVADGLGGHNAGEVASEDAARELGAHAAALPATLTPDELRSDLEGWFCAEHDYLLREGKADPSRRGMATTIAAVLFYRSHAYLINCGDSRVYLYDDDGLRQLSSDHSLFAITHSLADAHIITNCLGAGDPPYIDFTDITELLDRNSVEEGAVPPTLILCSDGLSDMLSDSKIEAVIEDAYSQSPSEVPPARGLIDATYKAGARDNVSVIIASVK